MVTCLIRSFLALKLEGFFILLLSNPIPERGEMGRQMGDVLKTGPCKESVILRWDLKPIKVDDISLSYKLPPVRSWWGRPLVRINPKNVSLKSLRSQQWEVTCWLDLYFFLRWHTCPLCHKLYLQLLLLSASIIGVACRFDFNAGLPPWDCVLAEVNASWSLVKCLSHCWQPWSLSH